MKFLQKPNGKTPWSTDLVPCPNGCANEDTIGRLTGVCGLQGKEFEIRLGVKWNDHMRPIARAAFDAVTALSGETPHGGFIVILGPNGCGKTHILQGAVNLALRNNVPAIWSKTEPLLQKFRDAISRDDFDRVYNLVLNAKLLCLDELGRQNNTDWAGARLFDLIDDRHRMKDDVLTIIASNLHLEDLPDYLQSRVLDTRVRLFQPWQAPDVRPIKEKA